MAASFLTIEQELQIVKLVERNPTWNRYLPNGAQVRASFFKFPPDPSPSTSDEEANPIAMRQRVLKLPPQANLSAAAKFMSEFLDKYHPNREHAIAGGFAMKLRGAERATGDIDIFFRGPVSQVLKVLIQVRRFILPQTTLHDHCFQMYLRTGPAVQDPGCESDHIIKVELLRESLHESGFQNHIVDLPVRIGGESCQLRTLDVFCLVKSKLHAFFDSMREKDYKDVIALMEGHAQTITAKKSDLDQESARNFVQEGMLKEKGESQERIDWARKILLVSRSPSPASGSR